MLLAGLEAHLCLLDTVAKTKLFVLELSDLDHQFGLFLLGYLEKLLLLS